MGRQLARVSVAPYHETLGSLLYPGFQHSLGCFEPLVQLAERVLHPKPHQLPHIGWRLDAGFGSDAAVKWLLARQTQLLVKGYNSRRAQKVVRQVSADDWQPVRPNKWVAVVPNSMRYGRCLQTLAVRWLTEAGRERCALLLHTLLAQAPLAVVANYDARGGTLESDLHQDKLGLQLMHRRKQHWCAQEAWLILTDMAHNLLIWSQPWMFADSPFASFGMVRLIQDVFTIPGRLEFKGGHLQQVSLQRSHPFAPAMLLCLERLFKTLS